MCCVALRCWHGLGWDRTPLFVSLLRLTLWADGEIHRSLTAAQILYFTIAYDWMLFGYVNRNPIGHSLAGYSLLCCDVCGGAGIT